MFLADTQSRQVIENMMFDSSAGQYSDKQGFGAMSQLAKANATGGADLNPAAV
jgi:hypothetical protein